MLAARAWRLGGAAEPELGLDNGERDRAREVRAWLLSAFEDAAIGIALVDLDPATRGRVLHVNPALCELVGRTRESLEWSESDTLVHADDQGEVRTAMAELATGALTRFRLEGRLARPDLQAVWVILNISIGRDRRGRPAYAVWQLLDIEERKRFEGELGYLADHDPLTGLLNRRAFVRELTERVVQARHSGGGGALLFMDIDDFKQVNDTLGHSAGDRAIAGVARAVEQQVRETDVLARLGGDEFGVLLPTATPAEAEALAARLLGAVRELDTLTPACGRQLTVSIGVAELVEPSVEMSADDLLIDSDLAMYAAKGAGKDRYSVTAPADHQRLKARLASGADRISRALAKDGFELHCQPIVDLRTRAIAQWELLLRLPDENGELIGPGEFLHSAERSGAIVGIDQWVLREATRLVAVHRDHGRELAVTVNVSGRSVADPAFPGFIEAQLQETAIDPASLVLEVTEAAAIANMDRAVAFAAKLTELGCRLALDDFGAGIGSFYYLKYIPFDFVKIDGEFVRELPSSPTDQLILDSIVQMSRGLGKRTIAEFAGDQATVEILRDRGVDFAQGYHVGRPMPVSSALRP